MYPKENGVTVLFNSKSFGPYQLFHADLWECNACGHQLITGYGHNPISEHGSPTFAEWAADAFITVEEQ